MKKVLVTASTFSHITNFHLPYLEEFRRREWEVHVACGGEMREIPFADRVTALPIEKSFFSPSNFKASAMLRRMVREQGYELVITHTSLAAFFTRLALFGLRKRPAAVNVVHGYLFDERTPPLKSAVLKAAELLTAPVTELVLTMNEWDTRWAKTHKVAREVKYIPGMGINEERLRGAKPSEAYGFSESDFVLVYPAEFSARKNQEFLIRTLPQLGGNIKLLLPGKGDKLEVCRTLARELGAEDRVIFPGHISDVAGAFLAGSAAVSSAGIEGLPFNIVEAMLCSRPIIASRIKGHTDLVEEGETGFLFDPDSAEDFVRAVNRLADDPQLCARMGKAGREKAQGFTLPEVFPAVMAEYLRAGKDAE